MSLRPAGFRALDVVTRVAPVGVRLWDVHTGRAADDTATVSLADRSGRTSYAVRSPSGVHSLHGLRGLGKSERGAGDPPFWYHPPSSHPYRLQIRDRRSTYLPMSLDVRLPFLGLLRPACALPDLDEPVMPVFSSCSRPVPAGFAAVRAQLVRRSGAPASWARVDVVLPDRSVAHGVADERGQIAVLFGYPELPAEMTGALSTSTWNVELRAWFGVGEPRRPVPPQDGVPELCDVLNQRPARLIESGRTPLTGCTLAYGRERVLRTYGFSTLLITGSEEE